MGGLVPTPASIRKWSELTDYQQAEAVVWAAAHLNRNAAKYQGALPKTVRSFASGVRERRPDRRRASELVEESVLIAFVEKKWTRAQERAAKPADWIPTHIKLSVPIPVAEKAGARNVLERELFSADRPDMRQRSRWRRSTIAIPVDVSELGDPQAEAAARKPHANRMFVFNQGKTRVLGGTVCAHVKRRATGDSSEYFLTCHHVAFRSNPSPTLAIDRRARVFSGWTSGKTVYSTEEIGTPSGRSLLKPFKTNQLDGGLVKLNAAGRRLARRKSFWRVQPVDWVKERARWLAFTREADPKPRITLTPWGGQPRIRLRFLRHEMNRRIKYKGGARAAIIEVFVFRCLNGRSWPGYSGSPITVRLQGGRDGLVAMHIAGEVKNGVAYSYAIPTYWLFPRNLLTEPALAFA